MDKYDENREKLINLFDIAAIPEKFIKTIDEGKIDFIITSRHSNIVGKGAEICVIYPELYRRVFVLYDYGYCIKFEEITINKFTDKDSRNREIGRLYHEEHLSQIFIGRLFKISQPSVSIILNRIEAV